MAFSQQEQEIVRWGFENGKTKEEVANAIAKFRAGIPAQEVPQEKVSFGQDAMGDIAETVSGVGKQFGEAGEKIVKTVGDKSLNPFEKAIQAGSQAFRGAARAFGEAVVGAGKTVLPQETEEQIGSAVQKVGETIAQAPKVQELVQRYNSLDPETKRNVDNALGYAEGLAEILTGGAASRVAKPVITATKEAVEKVGSIVQKAQKINLPKVPPIKTEIVDTVSKVANDITPKRDALRERFVANAFSLAPVEDLARIESKTGNSVGEFLGRYDLIKDNPAETLTALNIFKKENYNLVRDAISLVGQRFSFSDLPQVENSIDFLIKDLAERKSTEYRQAYDRLVSIKQKGDFDLMDAQYVKEVFDDIESVYTRTGDVRDAVLASDKAQTIAPVRRFIEDIVQQEYPDIDIRALNNNVMTAREVTDAILRRSGKADTASFFQLGDLAVVGAGNFTVPGAGYAAFFGKKVLESAPVQLRIARALDKWARTGKLDKTGLSREDLNKISQIIQDELGAKLDIDGLP